MNGLIYKTTNLVNGMIYVGQTKYNDPNYLGSGTYIKRAIKKYGRENFSREVLKNNIPNQKQLDAWELVFIKKLRATDPTIGYNILPGSATGFGYGSPSELPRVRAKIKKARAHTSPEACEKIRQFHIGRKASEETRRKMSEKRRMRESPSKGKKWTKEQREKLSEIRKKQRHTDNTKKLLSKLNKGSNNPNYGKRFITNGIVNKLIMKDDVLPEGWRYGCKQNHGNKKQS